MHDGRGNSIGLLRIERQEANLSLKSSLYFLKTLTLFNNVIRIRLRNRHL